MTIVISGMSDAETVNGIFNSAEGTESPKEE